ncbi:PAS domain-containing protein [Desulfobotulus sp. H1]|uniref:histidine kinase n=1 Tax=Desulfobotulus pelophilus TaxID=2823377 RepID=A0ABT3N8U9_9BACT|nr:PAS domain-containing protein [Desulfobotulus pelophilus]MCW7753880.1 PAS domain-containing protein [Desulfobotulus pelophilus]
MDKTVFLDGLRIFMEKELMDSRFAWWEWDTVCNRVTCNDLKVTMLGYDPAEFENVGYQSFTELLHPDDHGRTMQAMRDYLEGRAAIYQIDYRIRRKDGGYTWYMDRGCAVTRDETGRPVRMRGLVVNLGAELEQKARSREFVRQVRSSLPSPESGVEHIVTLCSVCQRFRLEDLWVTVPDGLGRAFPDRVSHGICPDCVRTLYPEFADSA